ncbi:macrophage mannose receptor 1-like [Anolis sagrei]|uniref:macrophage mannose receptor 1-like n=1 Tax=Anolis sagrei TaxID=38937 RepID=UPI00352088C6
MSAVLLLNVLFLIQPTFQVSEPDTFLIHNEHLNLCIQPLSIDQQPLSIILKTCNKDNEWQNFKWVSEHQIVNMATKLCLAVPSKTNRVPITFSLCNTTNELQRWTCRNESFLALGEENLFLQPAGGQNDNVVLYETITMMSTWKIYGTKDSLCTMGYEALFTLEGNAFGAPCVFPFKYLNKWYAKCIKDDEDNSRLWCGTTADVDKDSLTGYCPVKGDHDEFLWTKNHWTGDFYQINSHSALTWFQARKSCQQQNAELLSINELHEQTYLTGLTRKINTDYWIGLNSLDLDSGWEWAGNHPFRYLNWASGSPSPESEKLCGSMQSKNGNWANYKCDQKLGYICKKENTSSDSSAIPSDGFKTIQCQGDWTAYAGYCYYLNRALKSWGDALSSCRKADGDLISIHNSEEYSFVISQLGYKPTDLLWIGLNDQRIAMYFEWSDGTPVRFTKWQRGEPTHENNVQEDCVIMNGENGYWQDYFCEEQLGFICKRKPLASEVSEEVETVDPKCQKGWKRHGLYCYFIGQTTKTFSEAKTFCEAAKGFLTSVLDRYEQAYLTSLVGLCSERYFWIGLSDVEQPGIFNWPNGDNMSFTHWNSEMPGQHPGCVALRTGTAAGLWDVVDCKEKAAFLCKQWAEGVTPPPVPPVTVPPPCPDGWTPSPTRSVCFKAFIGEKYQKKTWFEAQDFCKEIGGDLPSIHNQEEQNVMENIDILRDPWTTDFWIGLNKLDPENGWVWSDKSPVDYINGIFGLFPDKSTESECKLFITDYGGWRTILCYHLNAWICQIKRGISLKPEPKNTFEYSFKIVEEGWVAYESNEYYFSKYPMPAEKAQAFCKTHGGQLTIIGNENERTFLWKYAYHYQLSTPLRLYADRHTSYIGLNMGLDGKFGWIDGSPVTYAAWSPNEPNFANEDEHCVVMYSSTGLWNDINCGAENGFICERHNRSVASTVLPTSPEPLGGCAQGWHLFDNKCFRIFGFHEEERKNWSAARTHCKSQGGNLASIPNKAVQAFLILLLKSISTELWIGLNDINTERSFLWTDGSGVYYTNWNKYFPRSDGDCVFMMKMPEKMVGHWRNGKCYNKKGYVCQRKTDTMLPLPETTLPPSGYTVYDNSSYSVVSPKMTWEEARKKCQSEKSELASILNPYIQSFLWLQVLKYKEPVWIGLNSKLTNDQYKWINGWRLKYTTWAAEEPKEKIACVYLDLDGHWKTGTCNEMYFSVCEKYHGILPTEAPETPGRCSKESRLYWIPFQAHCYYINPSRTTWAEAAMGCTYLGGTLASIENAAEMNFLLEHTAHLSTTSFWIGLFKNVDGEWIWLDNTELDFVNWKNGTPRPEMSHFSSQCIFMSGYNGEWDGEGCKYEKKGFICKTPKIPIEPTNQPIENQEQSEVPAQPHGTTVIVVFLVILILTGAGIAAYIFYKRQRKQQQNAAGFENALDEDNVIILQNDKE